MSKYILSKGIAMEWKIGEIKQVNGEWYQCVVAIAGCRECSFRTQDNCKRFSECFSVLRSDGTSVIFKKLEKVGEPIQGFQRYKLAVNKVTYNGKDRKVMVSMPSKTVVYIEIKQNKEDMEEKKLNLKPFSLELAKQGKPVCTRDGRKARIICFDRNDLYPIVALIECEDGKEMIGAYSKKGHTEIYEIKGTNLMMLPEKKEGWVNVDKGGSGKITVSSPYSTKEEAIHNDNETTIDTIKICWEE